MKILLVLYIISPVTGEQYSREVVEVYDSIEACAVAQAATGFHLPRDGKLEVYQCERPNAVET